MSGHGGARMGAGRPAGSLNRRTQAQVDATEATGISPLDYLLSVMRNAKNDDDTRIEAAKAAAPYVHAKLASVEVNGKLTISHEDALAALE